MKDSESGISVRVFKELFSQLENVNTDRKSNYHLFMSMFNVNNGKMRHITDLFKQDPSKNTRHKIVKDY